MTDRAEQGKPELLRVELVALHLQHDESMRPTGTVGPRPQQRRLPTAGGSCDDCHPPRRRAIQGSKKINPVDQPGSCPIHFEMPALLPAPDIPIRRRLSPLGIGPACALSTARITGIWW
jgi:hypothetical protein